MPAILIGVLLLALVTAGAFLGIPALSSSTSAATAAAPDGLEAHRVWVNGTFALHLTAAPCQFSEFRDDLEDRGVPPAMASIGIQQGRPSVPGCYALDLDGDVLVRDVAGTDGFIPIGWFKRQPRG